MRPTSKASSNPLPLCLAILSASALSASAQNFPDPLLYYDFDEDAGSIVATDGSPNGFDGDVIGSVTFGVAGAPNGASPDGAAEFSVGGTGIISVTGLDVPTLLGNRDGGPGQDDLSYTMACWILPDALSLSGDRFFFGQWTQGIHNGLRDNGRLHQAHWANDHYGDTVLNSSDWVHATFTYDGVNNLGTIYRNGVMDSAPASKDGPNGSGNFIVGARQGNVGGGTGQAHYSGLIDDVVIFQEVLSEDQIAALAAGASPVDRLDTDEDEMTDEWEIANLGAGAELDDGTVNVNFGPAGDPDNDGSSNGQEFTRRTDPMDDDTDDDGYKDGVETNTGAWDDVAETGTDPRNPDSDGDNLLDGVENPDLPYVGENQTGSDPNVADTDGDTFNDDIEVASMTDPSDEFDFPGAGGLPLVDDFEDNDFDSLRWLIDTTIPQAGAMVVEEGGHMRLTGRGHLYTREEFDPVTGGGIYIKGKWTYTGGDDFLQILTRSDAVPAGQYGETQTGIEFFAGQPGNGVDIRTRGGEITLTENQALGDISLNAGTTYEFYIIDDGAGELGFCIWEDGNRGNAAGVSDVVSFGEATLNHIAFHNREGNRTSNLEEVEIGALIDSDSDGMPDFWEMDNGLVVGEDDSGLDKDSDRVTNLNEFRLCLDPSEADTDGDGSEDGSETNSGTFVSEMDTGTDPLDPDTDNDELLDGVEDPSESFVDLDQPGTDPHNPDTDGDGFEDRFEIVKGSDPTDANSLPPVGVPLVYYDFEEGEGPTVIDRTLSALDGTIINGMTYADGAPDGPTPGKSGFFTTGQNAFVSVLGLDMNSMIRDTGDGSYTMACWIKPGEGTAGGAGFIFGQTNQGIHNGIRNGGVLHAAHWASDFNATTSLAQDVWVHALWTYDGTTDTATIYLDGVEDMPPTLQNAPNGGGNLLIGARNNNDQPDNSFEGCLDDVAIWTEVLPLETIVELAAGASPIGASAAPSNFRITDYTFDGATGDISITWNSKPGATYAILYDTDLGDFESDLDDGYPSDGESTTFSFNRAALGGDASAPRVYFRVELVE